MAAQLQEGEAVMTGRPVPVFRFDMDGVLCQFEHGIGRDHLTDPERHYFRDCPEDPGALAVFRALHALGPGLCRVGVLTRLFHDQEPYLKKIQATDKRLWSQDRFPWLEKDKNAFRCVDFPKHILLLQVPEEDRPYHILIDDDPGQLEPWRAAGGTGVQYLQDRHPVRKWGGVKVSQPSGPFAFLECLAAVARAL